MASNGWKRKKKSYIYLIYFLFPLKSRQSIFPIQQTFRKDRHWPKESKSFTLKQSDLNPTDHTCEQLQLTSVAAAKSVKTRYSHSKISLHKALGHGGFFSLFGFLCVFCLGGAGQERFVSQVFVGCIQIKFMASYLVTFCCMQLARLDLRHCFSKT